MLDVDCFQNIDANFARLLMTSGPKKYCEDNDVHHDGHSVRVATKVGNMIVDPLQSQQLQDGVSFYRVF